MARLFKTKTLLVILAFLFGMPVFSQNVEWALYDVENKVRSVIGNKDEDKYFSIRNFKDGMAIFKIWDIGNNGRYDKYGAINNNGEVVIPPIYTIFDDFTNGVARVKKDGKEGLINKQGVELLPLGVYDIRHWRDEFYVVNDSSNKHGLFYNGEMIIPCTYDWYDDNYYPFIRFYNYKNSNYDEIVLNVLSWECYDAIISYENVLVVTKGNEKFYFEKGTGKALDKKKLEQSSLDVKFFYDKETDKYGLWKKSRNNSGLIKEASYNLHSRFVDLMWYNDNAIVSKGRNGKKNSHILLSASGDELIKTKKGGDIYRFESTNKYLKVRNSLSKNKYGSYNKYGLYKSDGTELLPCKYEVINHLMGDYFKVAGEGYSYFLYDAKNNIYEDGTYYSSSDGMVGMKTLNGYYYVNLETGLKTDTYKGLYNSYSEGIAAVRDNENNVVLINKNGDIVTKPNIVGFYKIEEFTEGVAFVDLYSKDNKCGYIYNPLGHEDYEYSNKGGVSTDAVVTWIRIATDLFDQKRYADSKDYFYYAMLALPTNTYPIIGYSACLGNLGHYDEAIEVCYIALDIEPDNETAKNNLQIMIRAKEELEMRRQQEQEARQRELEEQRQRELEARQQQEYYAQQNNSSSGSFWDALSNFCTALDNALGSTYHSYDYSSSYNSSSSGSYQEQYNRWEQRAKSNYESLTNLGYDAKGSDGSRSGSTGQSMSGGNYTLQKKALREAQREMRNIRQRASQAGVYIKQSKYETATVGY